MQIQELRSAPEQLELAGRKLKLEAYLWRDFQPISPPDGRPLIASVKIQTTDGKALPKGIQVDSVWVLNRDNAWSPVAKEVRKGNEDLSAWEIVIRDGPKWGPDIHVDVVVLLKDQKGQVYLLRASDQMIHRTD
jgi:hypothetical protein